MHQRYSTFLRAARAGLTAAGLLLGLALVGCELLPGADKVRVLQRRDSVQGATWVAQETGTVDAGSVKKLTNRAKNFAAKNKADIAVVNLTPVGPQTVQFTIDAWKSDKE